MEHTRCCYVDVTSMHRAKLFNVKSALKRKFEKVSNSVELSWPLGNFILCKFYVTVETLFAH